MRLEWPEYPCPRFFLTLAIIAFGVINGLFGMAGVWYGSLTQFYGSVSVSSQLRGQSPSSLRRYLGLPQLLRHEAETQVWHYEKADCVLDIYLYPEGENAAAALAVRYAEARSRYSDAHHFNERTCLQSLVTHDTL